MVTLLLLDGFGFELEIHKNQPSNFKFRVDESKVN